MDCSREEGDRAGPGGDLLVRVGDGGGVRSHRRWRRRSSVMPELVAADEFIFVEIDAAGQGKGGCQQPKGGISHAPNSLCSLCFGFVEECCFGLVAATELFGCAPSCWNSVIRGIAGGCGRE